MTVPKDMTPKDQPTCRDRFDLRVELLTPLHIGAGVENSETDSPILTSGNQPVVPGSTIKGLFRSASESLAHVIPQASLGSLKASCHLNGGGCGQDDDFKKKWRQSVTAECRWHLLNEHLCATCRLYGSANWSSKIRFFDSHLDDMKRSIRDGVAIDRESGTASDGLKYDYEIVHPHQSFTISFEVHDADNLDKLLVALAIGYLRRGHMRIGGMTSRGLGTVRLVEDCSTWRHLDLADRNQSIAYFLGDEKEIKASPISDFLQSVGREPENGEETGR